MGYGGLVPSRAETASGAWWKAKLYKHHLVLGLVLAIVLALAWPSAGETISHAKAYEERIVPAVLLCVIFLIAGLLLDTNDLLLSLTQPAAVIYGFLTILLLTPMVGFIAVQIPFEVEQFATGFAVFCAVPTTFSPGVSLVYAAYGNDAMALMLSIGTNVAGIATVPFLLRLVLNSIFRDVRLDAPSLLVKLLVLNLVITLVGKALQSAFRGVRKFVGAQKRSLTLLSNLCLVAVIWMTLSRARDDIVALPFEQVLLLVISGIGLHLVYLALNHVLARYLLWLPVREYKAALIMGSQKSLPVAVLIVSHLSRSQFGRRGLIILPCIVASFAQLFIDAAIVARMASAEEVRRAAAAGLTRCIEFETFDNGRRMRCVGSRAGGSGGGGRQSSSGGGDLPLEFRVTYPCPYPEMAASFPTAMPVAHAHPVKSHTVAAAKAGRAPVYAFPKSPQSKPDLATRSMSCPM